MSRARREFFPQIMRERDRESGTWKSASVFKGEDGGFSLYAPTLEEARAAIEREIADSYNALEGCEIVGTRILERIVTDWEEVAS